jgi:hypothetical protein
VDEGTLGLENEQRSDFQLREIFVEVYGLVEPYLAPDGMWVSQAHECLAHEAVSKNYPELTGLRLFGVLGTIANVHASGRRPER